MKRKCRKNTTYINEPNFSNMYIGAIIGYLSWPFMIMLSYLAVRRALKYFEKQVASGGEE